MSDDINTRLGRLEATTERVADALERLTRLEEQRASDRDSLRDLHKRLAVIEHTVREAAPVSAGIRKVLWALVAAVVSAAVAAIAVKVQG